MFVCVCYTDVTTVTELYFNGSNGCVVTNTRRYLFDKQRTHQEGTSCSIRCQRLLNMLPPN